MAGLDILPVLRNPVKPMRRGGVKRKANPKRRKGRGDRHGTKMVEALKKAIRGEHRQGNISHLSWEEKILIGRAMLILQSVPDEVNDNPREHQD